MLLRTLLSHYRRHPVQALFLLTGIVIANVLLVGTLLINAQARASYDRGETLLRAGPAGQIRDVDPGRTFDERLYLRLRLQGFDMLAPVLRRVVRTGGGEPLELIGIDLFAMPRANRSGDSSPQGAKNAGDRGFADFAFPPFQLWRRRPAFSNSACPRAAVRDSQPAGHYRPSWPYPARSWATAC
jgi:putative ABC transport system permease protein